MNIGFGLHSEQKNKQIQLCKVNLWQCNHMHVQSNISCSIFPEGSSNRAYPAGRGDPDSLIPLSTRPVLGSLGCAGIRLLRTALEIHPKTGLTLLHQLLPLHNKTALFLKAMLMWKLIDFPLNAMNFPYMLTSSASYHMINVR